ncbi:MAG: hypothetical protein K8T10_11485 [Candidatus Eremiobacteraeota bacterium]|nr:hypothetical protein [Candidatus Eremiobacteraeota bacterium]
MDAVVRKIAPKKEENKNPGICASCKNLNFCTYPRNQSRPIMQCEEFLGFEPRTKQGKKVVSLRLYQAKTRKKEKELSQYKGLCRYCVNCEQCTLPRSEGGVWICDEYMDEE